MHTRTKQLWATTAAMTLIGACLVPASAANIAFATKNTGAPAPGANVTGNGTDSGTTKITSTTTTAAGIESDSDATTPALSDGQLKVANKVAAPFVTMAGSQKNAIALATALRTGTTANLIFPSTSPPNRTTQTPHELAIPTKPMGWGNVSHALALAQLSLRQIGIESPTAAELRAALDGGAITTADGKTVTLAGVLQQRAEGMGWGQIAKTYGTTMGAVNRGVKAHATTVASSTPAPAPKDSSAATQRTVVTGATHERSASRATTGINSRMSHGSEGLTTATATHAINGATGHSAKGITTAFGATAGRPPG